MTKNRLCRSTRFLRHLRAKCNRSQCQSAKRSSSTVVRNKETSMANAIVSILVRNTYVECVAFSTPSTIVQHKHSKSDRKPTSAKLNIAKQMVCELHFSTAAHTQLFSICLPWARRETIWRTRLAAPGCGNTATRIVFASNSSRCGWLRRERHLCSGDATHKCNLRSA